MALTEAYRKGYWRLPKVANVLSECVFHRTHRIHVSAMRFFLGSAQDEEGGGGSDDEDDFGDEEDQPGQDPKVSLSTAMGAFKHAKKTRKRLICYIFNIYIFFIVILQ
jgi:hypothetical protein